MKQFDKTKFVGRKFQCNTTKEVFTIPEDVRPKAFYMFGDGCFIDVGDGYYSRWGGDFTELKEIQSEVKK